MSTSPVEAVETASIPVRGYRQTTGAAQAPSVDVRLYQPQVYVSLVRTITPDPKHVVRFTGVELIERAKFLRIETFWYDTPHAPESKQLSGGPLMPNKWVTKDQPPYDIANFLDREYGMIRNSRGSATRTGAGWLPPMSGFSENAQTIALQMLAIPIIQEGPGHLKRTIARIKSRLGRTLDELAAISREEIRAEMERSQSEEIRQAWAAHERRVAQAVKIIRGETPVLHRSGGQTVSCEAAVIETIKVLDTYARNGLLFCEAHKRIVIAQLERHANKGEDKGVIDDFDADIFLALGEEPPTITQRTQAPKPVEVVINDQRPVDTRPKKKCYACDEDILAKAKTCEHCRELQPGWMRDDRGRIVADPTVEDIGELEAMVAAEVVEEAVYADAADALLPEYDDERDEAVVAVEAEPVAELEPLPDAAMPFVPGDPSEISAPFDPSEVTLPKRTPRKK